MIARLSVVQRMVLTFMFDQAKKGKNTLIVPGHKKTRVGFVGEEPGIATCTTTLFFLRHHRLIEALPEDRYRLTAEGEAALRAPKPSGVVTSMEQWRRRTRGISK